LFLFGRLLGLAAVLREAVLPEFCDTSRSKQPQILRLSLAEFSAKLAQRWGKESERAFFKSRGSESDALGIAGDGDGRRGRNIGSRRFVRVQFGTAFLADFIRGDEE